MDGSVFNNPRMSDAVYDGYIRSQEPTGYRRLGWDKLPAKTLLRAAGFPGKIPFGYRGTNTDEELAALYVEAWRYGWQQIIKNRTVGLQRHHLIYVLGLSATAQQLLLAPDEITTFRKLIAAYTFLGIKPKDAAETVYYDPADVVLRLVLQRNGYNSFSELPTDAAALLLLVIGNMRNKQSVKEVGHTWDWRDISLMAAWALLSDAAVKDSDILQCLQMFSLQEIMHVTRQVPRFNTDIMRRMVVLHQQGLRDIETLLPYLQVPQGLFEDLYPRS